MTKISQEQQIMLQRYYETLSKEDLAKFQGLSQDQQVSIMLQKDPPKTVKKNVGAINFVSNQATDNDKNMGLKVQSNFEYPLLNPSISLIDNTRVDVPKVEMNQLIKTTPKKAKPVAAKPAKPIKSTPTKPVKLTYPANGEVNDNTQGEANDCWLLSGINALNQTPKGKEILKKAVTVNKDKQLVQIYLKGVNKYYNVPFEAIENAVKTGQYSDGDSDIIAIELAVKKYRESTLKNKSDFEKAKDITQYWGNFWGNNNKKSQATVNDDPLAAGAVHEAFYLLTGQTGQTDYVNIMNIIPGALSINDDNKKAESEEKTEPSFWDKARKTTAQYIQKGLEFAEPALDLRNQAKKKVFNMETAEDYLTKMAKEPNRYAAVCMFNENGVDDKEKQRTIAHVYYIKAVVPNGKGGYNVQVMNPWNEDNPENIINYSKEEFLKNVFNMNILDTKTIK